MMGGLTEDSIDDLICISAMRGYMTQRGVPDCPRSSRYILKDYVNVGTLVLVQL